MSKKQLFLSVLAFFVFCLHFAQHTCAYGQNNDPRAQKIIDDMAARFKTFPSVSIDFSITITSIHNNSESVQNGKIWIKGEKYKLEIPDYVIYFDGAKVYQYLTAVNEVVITKPDPYDDDEGIQLLNPQTYFNLSSRNFLSNFLRESVYTCASRSASNNRSVSEIDLYPILLETSRFSRIRIKIERTTSQLVFMRAFMINGVQYTLNFMPYSVHQTALRDSFFVFNEKEHPDVEVIDLTF